ncbi:hypothetical protein EV663_107112 [Rhodovulum bhavnagarense]|uniref:Uncharacterized protein n=1 Tax=Rhodovulum bhavnagarense TaxID=992286 RepID=A0A4R2RFS5_9RHOB|nr:hypothetical protein EV663_107112 [Rhodovulum bhavnagarense]
MMLTSQLAFDAYKVARDGGGERGGPKEGTFPSGTTLA